MTPEECKQLAEGAALLGVVLDVHSVELFSRFSEMLYEANREINLTRIPPEEVVTLHFLDSLALAKVYTIPKDAKVLDVGTGAGFPGIPLAIAFPQAHYLLIEATRKKVIFVERVIRALGLENVEVSHAHAEELVRERMHRGHYDLVIARAVAALPGLVKWMLPFVKPGGVAVAYKSETVEEELREAERQIRTLGGYPEEVVEVLLPFCSIARRFVLLRKGSL